MPNPRDRAEVPDAENPGQDDESAQSQTLTEAILDGDEPALGDSEKVPTGDISDDVPDLVDHMRQMESSGRIDMSAFAGERNDDEEEGRYGPAADEE